MDARSRTLARLRSLLAISATAASTQACEQERGPRTTHPMPEPMPYTTSGYQTSDPAAPPMRAVDVEARARWIEGAWIPRIELTLLPQVTPTELRVVEVLHATMIEQRIANGTLVLVLEPATENEPQVGVAFELRDGSGPTEALQALLYLTAGSTAIACSVQPR